LFLSCRVKFYAASVTAIGIQYAQDRPYASRKKLTSGCLGTIDNLARLEYATQGQLPYRARAAEIASPVLSGRQNVGGSGRKMAGFR